MTSSFSMLDELTDKLAGLEREHLLRSRRTVESAQGARIRVDGQDVLNFCGNDYLGLANDPRLKAAAATAIETYGVGSGASHLVCGHQLPHEQLETEFAAFVGLPAAISFATGYMANLGVITSLVGRGDAVFADKLNHASLNDACVLSRAEFLRFPHGDLAALERQLATSTAKRKLIAVDAVYSMDGDLAPVPALLALAEKYDAWLYLDDAHGFGVLGQGRGSMAHWAVASPRLIYLATLGKAVGTAGAVVAGETNLVAWLVNKARTGIYTTAAPAAIAAATLAALAAIKDDGWRRDALSTSITQLRNGLAGSPYALMPSMTSIQPIVVASNEQALSLSRALFARGLWVAAIRPPTVPTPRLRVTVSAVHTAADIDLLISSLLALA
ncbi:MAG: 8-amino-7-oxononanoate synthase [Burkholderiales bacterium]|nr:8-amino-7-oxononanoate synthase [Burkholderiales bacterium]